jgi:flagellar motor switch protein FliN/FliY
VTDTATQEQTSQTEAEEAENVPAGEGAPQPVSAATSDVSGSPPLAEAHEDPAAGDPRRRDAGSLSPAQGPADHPIEPLSNVELEAAVELGRTNLLIGDVLKLRTGSLVQLDKMLGEPAELVVKGNMIAKGEVVVVDDRFGLRITEVLSRAGG